MVTGDKTGTFQSRQSESHVYGGRSRFVTEKVLKHLDAATFQGSSFAGVAALEQHGEHSTLDVSARLKEMW